MHEDGRRRWLYPRVSPGRFLARRRIVAWLLIAVFTLLPYLRIHGKPAVLLNIPGREFTLLGYTFLPTDTLLLALFLVTLIIGIFLMTALFGRVWCGWMCPQTVYTEFLYRPLERLFDGPPGPRNRPGTRSTPLRKVAKYVTYLLVSAFLAHTFLAYFVGVESLLQWVRQSPLQHPTPFLVMVFVTAAMMFDFSYFREQTCIVACPYGRFQSVMLDRDSLIISYDPERGEPRGKGRRTGSSGSALGDCIDCHRCVDTCPTGIDIRDGLQMECIACTQCIDACDDVMDKIRKPRGLIRFSSQSRIEGTERKLLRPRVVIYPTLVVILLTAFSLVLAGKQSADVTLLRGFGQPYTQLQPGQVTNLIRVNIKNRSGQDQQYRMEVVGHPEVEFGIGQNPVPVAANQSHTETISLIVPREAYREGKLNIQLRITDGGEFDRTVDYQLLGPR
jgi:cytochrome c oxidase accessory protein FixG